MGLVRQVRLCAGPMGRASRRRFPSTHAQNRLTQDHQTEVTLVAAVEYSQPWLGFLGSVGEWSP